MAKKALRNLKDLMGISAAMRLSAMIMTVFTLITIMMLEKFIKSLYIQMICMPVRTGNAIIFISARKKLINLPIIVVNL